MIDELDIAIIGLSGRFPGARNLEDFWHNLRDGVESISFFTNEELKTFGIDAAVLNDSNYVKAKPILEDIEYFDASFFGITAKEAEVMDPQQRLFLECAWEALEIAGYTSAECSVGVYAGASMSSYLLNLAFNSEVMASVGELVNLGNVQDALSTKVSYKLNLKGPSYTIQTACSTSLVAVHLACQSLLNSECDLAIAGGVRIEVPHKSGYIYNKDWIESPDGHCRAFDAKAQGTVLGSGVGVVVLKKLESAIADGDYIHAVIKGSATNNDGCLKVSYAAPSVDGQAKVIVEALANAGVEPDTITYIETHGTGTSLGDPIEVQALAKAFRASTQKQNFCAIGSVKTNVGHLDRAAGVASLIKTVLALKHKQIPPSLHFQEPNPEIDFVSSPFYVNNSLAEWKTTGTPRRAGVSSFGIGGTNAHIILEEAPVVEPSNKGRSHHILVISAKTDSALETATVNLANHLKQHSELNFADVAYTLAVSRQCFAHRRILVSENLDEAVELLQSKSTQQVFTGYQKPYRPSVVFMFSGQGAQYVNMGRELYQTEPTFQKVIDYCCQQLKPYLNLDLRSLLYPSEERTQTAQQLTQTSIAQPALFVVEYALAQLWLEWGVNPQAAIGHSIGEYVAATLAGVFSLEAALALVAIRGQLMQQLPPGAMLAVPLSKEEIAPLLGEQLSLAADNAPSLCVVSGATEVIDDFQNHLREKGIDCQRLHTSGAFHSQLMDAIAEPFLAQVKKVKLNAPKFPFVSNLTGTWITATEAVDPNYWLKHLRQTVRFAEGIAELLKQPERILLEVGPGQTLSTLANKQKTGQQVVLSSLRHPQSQQSDVTFLLNTLSQLWLNGVNVDWSKFYAHEQRHRLPLPTYPFERKKYWIESLKANNHNLSAIKKTSVSEPENAIANSSPQDNNIILSILKDILSNLLGISSSEIDIHAHFLEMGVDSLVFSQISRAIQEKLGIRISFRLLLEELTTIDALATYIAQELPTDHELTSKLNLQPPLATAQQKQHTDTSTSQEICLPVSNESVASTAIEQLMAQQLQIMSKQLDLLRDANLSQKVLPSWQTSQSSFITRNQNGVSQTSTSHTSQSTDFSPKSNQIESEQKLISDTITANAFVRSPEIHKQAIAQLNLCQQKHLDELIGRYVERTKESKKLSQDYRSYHANSRAITGFFPAIKEIIYPIHGQRGEGARLWDVDGNEYVDISMGFGTLLFGHSPSFVTEALQEQIQQGILHGPQSRLSGKVAKLICELTNQERAAFCSDGTEAVMGAIRIARAVTGRSKIALFAGSYHGTFDGVLVRGVATGNAQLRSVPAALGIPSYMAEDAIILEYGSLESLDILKIHAQELAAILVEPVQSNRLDLQPQEFLCELRELTRKTGTVLIFDEVISGFRMHPGGIQALWNIQADLTTYGKAVGAGLPIGVIAGKAGFMDALDGGFWNYGDASYPQAETTIFMGTFFKHPLVMTAAWAALNHIKNNGSQLQENLTQRTTKLANTLNNYFEQQQVPIRVVNFGSLFQFTPFADFKFIKLFFYHLLEKGVYVWEGSNRFLSTAHTDEDIEQVIRAVKESVVEMQAAEFFPTSSLLEPFYSPQQEELKKVSLLASSPLKNKTLTVPLTEAQKELCFLAKIKDEASRAYNESRTIYLQGLFNFQAVRKAVQEVINRHEVLRTTFSLEADEQRIHANLSIDIPLIDFSTLATSQQQAQLSELLAREARQTFDFELGPLLRVHVIKLAEEYHLLVLTIHHIVADGWSMGILLQELSTIYLAECQGIAYQLPQPSKWSDYAQRQANLQQSQEMAKAEAYWLKQFATLVPILELPSDRPRPPIFTHAGAREQMAIATSLYQQLKNLSIESGCTLFTTLLAGFIVLLRRLSAQEDIVVGIASAGRSLVEGEYLIGHCVNLLPIRTQVIGNPTFTEFLSLCQQVLLDASEHQIYPFIKLVEKLNLPRDPSRTPIFTVGFNLDKAQQESSSLNQKAELVKNFTDSTKFDLDLNIIQTDNELLLEFEYNTDLFNHETIQRWMGHYITLLEGIVANPQQRLGQLPLLIATQQHQLLVEWNDPQTDYFQNQCIHQLFEAQVERSPDAIAVVFADQHLTYQELNQRANQLAHHLQTLGVKPEVLVGICVERSLEMIVAILGILKAGGAYVPLDPTYPQERLSLILEDTQVSVILTQQQLIEVLPEHQIKVFCLDTDWESLAQESQHNPVNNSLTEDLAYIIYTSGSTGKPKGVLINHQNVTRLFAATQSKFHFNQQDVWTLFHSIAFDFSVWELWGALLNGGRLVVVPYWVSRSPDAFYDCLCEQQVTILNQTPSAFYQLIKTDQSSGIAKKLALRLVIFGGESLEIQSLQPWFERHGDQFPQLVNMYGITETTVHITCRFLTVADLEVTSGSIIGRPIPDLQVYLLDQQQQPVAIGVPGEMYIGGAGLARGYLNRPELTAQKFIPHPFSNQPNARLYRSGDLACYLSDRNIKYLGRIDQQVKIRGFRIELGEIEAILAQHPNVQEVIVLAREDVPSEKQLVAYVVPRNKQTPTTSELKNFLKKQLPEYMLPSAFVMLETLPLTANGKVDRQALFPPETLRPELVVAYVMPQTEVEKSIAQIWQQALNIEQIGIDDNFFELGGHSLLIVKVHSQLREIFKTDISILDLFRYPTISSLAEYLSKTNSQTLSEPKTNIQLQKLEAGKTQQKKRLQKMKSLGNSE